MRNLSGSWLRSRRSGWLCAILAAAILAIPGCVPNSPKRGAGRTIVIVEASGLSWPLISPMLADGRLPVLAGLYRNGSAGILKSLASQVSGVIETTMASGQPASVHGLPRTVERIPGEYLLRAVGADRRKVPALWSFATAAGVTVGVVRWPGSFPAEPVAGFMLAGLSQDGERRWLYPEGALGSEGWAGDPIGLPAPGKSLIAMDAGLEAIVRRDLEALARGLTLHRVYQPSLFLLHLDIVDAVAHSHWQFHDPQYQRLAFSRGRPLPEPERVAQLGPAVARSVEFFDACLGLLMARLPERTTLLVVSSWGMRGVGLTDYLDVDLNRLLAKMGWLVAESDSGVDWSRTQAFSLVDDGQRPRAIYLNIAGREHAGVVPPERAAAFRETVARALTGLSSTAGQPLFLDVRADPDPAPGDADILVTPNIGIDPSGMLALGDETIPIISLWSRWGNSLAAHDPEGILILSGEGVVTGRVGFTADALDIVPTALALLQLAPPHALPGRVLSDVLTMPEAILSMGVAVPPATIAPQPVKRAKEPAEAALDRMRESGHLPMRSAPLSGSDPIP